MITVTFFILYKEMIHKKAKNRYQGTFGLNVKFLLSMSNTAILLNTSSSFCLWSSHTATTH